MSYIPSESGWGSQRANWGQSSANSGYLYLKCVRTYHQDTNKSDLVFSLWCAASNNHFNLSGTIKVGGSNLATFDTTQYVNGSGSLTDFHQVRASNHDPLTWSRSGVSHDSDGKLSLPIQLDLTFSTGGSNPVVMLWGNSATFTATETRASTITSVTNPVTTGGTLLIQVNRANSAYYHKAKITAGNNPAVTLYESTSGFAESLSIQVPRSWFDSFTGQATLYSAHLEVTTYTDSSCTTQVGSAATTTFRVNADAGMAPVLADGFATAVYYNTGTAAAGISGYVSGVSKAQVTMDVSKVTLANNATLQSITVDGVTASGTPPSAITGVLNGTATITVIVTDSRGLSATKTLTVQTMQYAAPTITGVTVQRCDSLGDADDDGNYVSVKATGGFSSLPDENDTEQNSVTLTAALAEGGGSYGSENALTSGTAVILGGTLNPDVKLDVRITATDALNSSAKFFVMIPGRVWAMKFRASGQGVGFGMAPDEENVLQLPTGWKIKIGTTVVAHD